MGGQGYPPEIVRAAGAKVMVTGGLGRKAVEMFEEFGIMVYVGASGSVKDALKLYNGGHLEAATDENACAGHGDHDGHHEGCDH